MPPHPQVEVSRQIKADISRAKNYLRKDTFLKSFDAALVALLNKAVNPSLGRERVEVELLFVEYCDELSNHPRIREFLSAIGVRADPFMSYRAGEEKKLAARLNGLKAKMLERQAESERKRSLAREEEKRSWLASGKECLASGQFPKGKVYLKRLVDKYGREPDIIPEVCELLLGAGLPIDASEMLEVGIQAFPADSRFYKLLVQAYADQGEFAKAEKIYLDGLKQFGAHPLTLLNISRFYLTWRKRDDAYDFARRALDLDPGLEEAREIMRKSER